MNGKKLSIVFVTNNYTPYQGGVVSSIKQQLSMLQQLGHKVHLITLDFKPGMHDEPHVTRLFCPIRFNYKTNPMAVPWLPTSAMQQLIEQIKPDIIHTHHPFLLGTAALKAAKKYQIPIVFTYHTFYHHYLHYIPLPQPISKPFVENHVDLFCAQVDGIIAPSTAVRQLILQRITTHTTVIPSAVSPLFFNKKEKRSLQRPINLLTVSRFTKEKNLYFLLDVIAMLAAEQYTLTLIGYGAEYPALKEYAYHTKKLDPATVRFIERPSVQVLAQAYRQADLFLFASTTDTQGIVLGEAMASGTPVIAIDGPGQRDIIHHGFNGFIVTTKEEMVEKIELVTADPILFDQLQSYAHIKAYQLRPEAIMQQVYHFYRTIIEQHQ